VTDDASVFRLIRAEQRLSGQWVKLDKNTPARAKAGKKLRLRLVLGNPEGNETVPLVYRIPAKAAGQRGRLSLSPGFPFPFETGDMPTTITGMKKLLRTFVRNDQFEGRLGFFTEVGSIERTKKTAPATRVVSGNRRIKVVVE
jgi:hypothetical protein